MSLGKDFGVLPHPISIPPTLSNIVALFPVDHCESAYPVLSPRTTRRNKNHAATPAGCTACVPQPENNGERMGRGEPPRPLARHITACPKESWRGWGRRRQATKVRGRQEQRVGVGSALNAKPQRDGRRKTSRGRQGGTKEQGRIVVQLDACCCVRGRGARSRGRRCGIVGALHRKKT